MSYFWEDSFASDVMVIHKKKIEFLILWTQLKAYAYGMLRVKINNHWSGKWEACLEDL